MLYISSPYLFVAVNTEGRIGKVTSLLLFSGVFACVTCHGAIPQRHVLNHPSQRTRQPDAIVLSNQETLVTVLTRSVWFRARVTGLLLFEAPSCQA